MLIISLLLKQIMSENRKRLRREKGSGFFPGPDTVEVKWMSESQGRDKRKGITFYRYVQHAHTHTHTHTHLWKMSTAINVHTDTSSVVMRDLV